MENKYFKEALASMAAGVAYVDAVKHLHDKGYSVEDIKKNLDYPATTETIENVIKDYEAKKTGYESKYEYIQKTDEYGRRSFIRVEKDKY